MRKKNRQIEAERIINKSKAKLQDWKNSRNKAKDFEIENQRKISKPIYKNKKANWSRGGR